MNIVVSTSLNKIIIMSEFTLNIKRSSFRKSLRQRHAATSIPPAAALLIKQLKSSNSNQKKNKIEVKLYKKSKKFINRNLEINQNDELDDQRTEDFIPLLPNQLKDKQRIPEMQNLLSAQSKIKESVIPIRKRVFQVVNRLFNNGAKNKSANCTGLLCSYKNI